MLRDTNCRSPLSGHTLRHKAKRYAGFDPMALFYSLSYPLYELY